MKFSIITPTHKRPIELKRAIESALNQTYTNWEMIIVNDSPDFDYSSIENSDILKDERIKYFKNKENKGLNYSRNVALDNISENSDYITFLDDDDWLNSECLNKAVEIIKEKPNFNWYVSNHIFNGGGTLNTSNKHILNYVRDYLILKKLKGDATHIISTKYKNLRFSKKVKQAEEWMYFAQIPEKFYYYNFNSKISEGYLEQGISKIYKNKKEKLKNTYHLYKELFKLKNFNLYIWLIYLPLRIGAILLR